MADAALYRQIVDVLLAEHEKSTPPQPQDADTASMLSVTWGLYCQVHRLARASILLADNGMGQEGVVLQTDVFFADDALVGLDLQDAVDQQERRAMRDQCLDLG